MYFIKSGTVSVVTSSGTNICNLYDGEYFGEISIILTERQRLVTVVAIEFCELYKMDSKDFIEIIIPITELNDRFEKVAYDRYMEVKTFEKI